MTIQEVVQSRHSVRQYADTPLSEEQISALKERIGEYNAESGLNIQLMQGDSKVFSGPMARFMKFSGTDTYFALVGPKSAVFREKMGYYGEKLVLDAQMMGLNTCWVGGTFSKSASSARVEEGEQLVAVIALGYGLNQGKAHVSKPIEELADGLGYAPSWYRRGVECAALAPSAMNHQNFHFEYICARVKITGRPGPYSDLDRGIARLHFELGAGKENVRWEE